MATTTRINLQDWIPYLRSDYAKDQVERLHNQVDTAVKELNGKADGYRELKDLFEEEWGPSLHPEIIRILEIHFNSIRLEKLERLRLRPRYRLRRIRNDPQSNGDEATFDLLLKRYRPRMVDEFKSLRRTLLDLESRTREDERDLGQWIVTKLKDAIELSDDTTARDLLTFAANKTIYQSHA